MSPLQGLHSPFALSLALTVLSPAYAKPPTVPLNCVKASDARAERQYLGPGSGGGNIYSVTVTFIGHRPSNVKTENALRECISAAVKIDDSKDVLATAWFKPRKGASDYHDEQLNPFGSLKFISYTAVTRTIAVHDIKLTKKK